MIDKIILSNLDLNDESKFNQYASQFTVDDLLDIFNRFKNDIQKKESVEKILRIKHSTLYKKAKTNEINLPEDICDKTKFRQRAFKYKLDDLLKWYSSVKDPEKKQAIESILICPKILCIFPPVLFLSSIKVLFLKYISSLYLLIPKILLNLLIILIPFIG